MALCVADRRGRITRDYMKALCCRFETTSRRAEYLGRKIEWTYRHLTRLLNKPEQKMLCGRKSVSTASSLVIVWLRASNRSFWRTSRHTTLRPKTNIGPVIWREGRDDRWAKKRATVRAASASGRTASGRDSSWRPMTWWPGSRK